MVTIFVSKTYKEIANKQVKNIQIKAIWVLDIDKFAFQALNYLAYNYKISRQVIANMLLNLLEFYSLKKTI